MEQNSHKAQWQLWLGVVVGVACLAAVFVFFARPGEIIESLKHVHLGYLLLGMLGVLAFMVIRAIRLLFMLDNSIPYSKVFHIQNIGYMLSQLLPLRLGDVARVVLIGNVPPVTMAQGLSTLVIERLLDLLLIVILLPFAASGISDLPEWMRSFAQGSGLIAIASIGLLIIAANQRERTLRIVNGLIGRLLPFLDRPTWVNRFDGLLLGLKSLTNLRDGLILAFLTIMIWAPIIIAYYFTMLAVNLEPTWIMAAFVVCAAALSVAVPSTPGQAGPFHFAVIAALQLFGQPAAESASFAFLYHIGSLLVMVILGVIGIFSTGVTFSHVINSARSFAVRQGADQH